VRQILPPRRARPHIEQRREAEADKVQVRGGDTGFIKSPCAWGRQTKSIRPGPRHSESAGSDNNCRGRRCEGFVVRRITPSITPKLSGTRSHSADEPMSPGPRVRSRQGLMSGENQNFGSRVLPLCQELACEVRGRTAQTQGAAGRAPAKRQPSARCISPKPFERWKNPLVLFFFCLGRVNLNGTRDGPGWRSGGRLRSGRPRAALNHRGSDSGLAGWGGRAPAAA